ncbi:TPA: hypothetical protein ACSBY0_002091 [Acinetobacter baumannii]
MKKNSLNRIIFNEGLNTLKILVFVVFVVYILKYFLNVYLGVVLSGEMARFFGIFMTLLIVIYDYISGIINKLSNKLQEETDRKEAIKILEANQLKVGLILSELPLDLNNLEKRECVEAYITLKDQNSQFVLVNSDNEVNARLYFLGKYADHNKYKLILKRNLD